MVTATDTTSVRRLSPADLDAVVAIDGAIVGHARHTYFERRLRVALGAPALHVQLAVDDGSGALAGYVLARLLAGEFGQAAPALRLEVIGVRPDAQGHALGDALVGALARWAKEHDVREIRTQASWRDHRMLRFFDHAGFELSANQVVECEVQLGKANLDREPEPEPEAEPTGEIDYGSPPRGDHDALARDRFDVRLLRPEDAAAVARIDRKVTGRDRQAYLAHAVKEALEGSAVRVSLLAWSSGAPVGFVMAKTDLGDYGRTEPVAVIDTLDVDPAFSHHGVGRALLSQLFVNLGALQVERVESVVARENFGLLGFLYRIGFGPSRTLAFVKRTVG